MSFTAVSKIGGVHVSTFLGNLAYSVAYIDATAVVTNVSTDAISIIDVSNDERKARINVAGPGNRLADIGKN
jgi:hypothetical protein